MPVPAARHRVGHPAALCGQWCGPGTRRTALAMENMGVLMRPSMMLRRCHEQNEKRRVRTQSAPPAAGEHCSEVPGHRDNMCDGGDECARACRGVPGASLTRKGEDEGGGAINHREEGRGRRTSRSGQSRGRGHDAVTWSRGRTRPLRATAASPEHAHAARERTSSEKDARRMNLMNVHGPCAASTAWMAKPKVRA